MVKIDDTYNRLDSIPACDRRMDRQMDGQTSYHGIVRTMHMHRAVKMEKHTMLKLRGEVSHVRSKWQGHTSCRHGPNFLVLLLLSPFHSKTEPHKKLVLNSLFCLKSVIAINRIYNSRLNIPHKLCRRKCPQFYHAKNGGHFERRSAIGGRNKLHHNYIAQK